MANKRIKRLLISRGYWDSQRLYTWTHVHFIIIKKNIYIYFLLFLYAIWPVSCQTALQKYRKLNGHQWFWAKNFCFNWKKAFFFFKTIVINLTMYGLGKRIEHVDPTVSVYIYMSSCLSIRKRKKKLCQRLLFLFIAIIVF